MTLESFIFIAILTNAMPVDHYENFPVASILLPEHLRAAVESIYAFARTADDIADEGDTTAEQRLFALNQYETELTKIELNEISDIGLFQKLNYYIGQHRLPLQAFRDLLSAFKQDVVITRYQSFTELLDYCRRSANPVGTLMLHLYKETTPDNLKDSAAICSALQLINFWQDVAVDWHKQRIYLPLDDLTQFGITEQQLANGQTDKNWQQMMRFQTARARTMMLSGSPLCKRLKGRIGWELRLVVQGGLRILERIDAVHGDVFRHRPSIGKSDWLVIAWRAIWM